MLGDLPIPLDESGRVTSSVDWDDFTTFMKRLEHHVGGLEELETCGQRVGELRPARVLRGLAGFSASPVALYRGASRWALRRAIPAIDAEIEEIEPNRIEIRARIKKGLRPCPQLFHLGAGTARALPRILGMTDAVVSVDVHDYGARYQIRVPPSRTFWAAMTRFFRTLFSANAVLRFLEAQQLELHEKHEALRKANAALADSARRYRAITDTAVDVLCELNERGQIEYVSASVKELLGYTPEQVTGSHFSLWVASRFRDVARKRLASFMAQPIEQPISRQRIRLHTESGESIVAELSLRSYRTEEGESRMVGILRDQSDRHRRSARERPKASLPAERLAETPRMAEIVEGALVRAPDDAAPFRWLETEKLVDMVEFEFHARSTVVGAQLQIDVARAPHAIWGDQTLLAAGLRNLIDWTIAQAPEPPIVILGVTAADDGGVSITVSTAFSPAERGNAIEEMDEETLGSLNLAAAERSVHALGGRLLPEVAAGCCVTRIELPGGARTA
jgi:PAS domain S-box-containing protein